MRQVVDLARVAGWHVVHFPQMLGNPAGFPDLLLWRDGQHIVAELKRAGGKPTTSQEQFLDRYRRSGVPAYLWRPDDWPEIRRVLTDGMRAQQLPLQEAAS